MELIVRVLACVAERLGIRATARVFEVEPNTVLHWLVEAAVGRRVHTLCQGEDGVQHQLVVFQTYHNEGNLALSRATVAATSSPVGEWRE